MDPKRPRSSNNGSASQSPSEGTAPMSDFNLSALTALRVQLKSKVEMGPHLNDILEIAAGGFMTKPEAQSVRNAADSQMGRLIEILQGKGDKEFDTFCEMLRKSNYSVWADKLKQEAEANKEVLERKLFRSSTSSRGTLAKKRTIGGHHFCILAASSNRCLLAVLFSVCVTVAVAIIWRPSYFLCPHTSLWDHSWKGIPLNVDLVGTITGGHHFCTTVAGSNKCLLAVLVCVCITAAIQIICFRSCLPWLSNCIRDRFYCIWKGMRSWKVIPWKVDLEGTTITVSPVRICKSEFKPPSSSTPVPPLPGEDIQVHYDRSSKQSEQTAEENQQLLASNDELKEKVQELDKASQALQEKLSAKQELLDEQQREITALRAQLSSLQEMEAVPVPLVSDVAEQTVDETLLQQLCYMATGIKQLLISPNGGTFKLGCGDASLVFPPGAVEKEMAIHYAIILHGPFVFPAGYKPGSVVVYINMDGNTLLKPAQLFLCHWCIWEEGDDEGNLKFIRAPHTLDVQVKEYTFEEQEEDTDFTTRTNVGVLTIREPRCLYCVETKVEKIARYSAITFKRNPSGEVLLFRIQLMCDSLEWNKKLTSTLEQSGWQNSSNGIVPRFSYSSAKKPIAASTTKSEGLGWEATIEGQHEVIETDFLMLKGKSGSEMEQEVNSGRFPPCLCYKILYTSPEERRVTPVLLKVDLLGANVHLTFSCEFKEEPKVPVPSPTSSGPSQVATTPPSSPPANIRKTADVIKALDHQLDAQWREFGTFLYVDPAIMDGINRDSPDVGARMLQLVENWLYYKDGTGNLPRTWKTVVQAVKNTGKGLLAQQLSEQ